MWVRAALSIGLVVFINNVVKCRRIYSFVFGVLRDFEVISCSGGFESRLVYSYYCWLIIVLILSREGFVCAYVFFFLVFKLENNRRIVFLRYFMR